MSQKTLYTSIGVVLAVLVVGYFFFILNPSNVMQNLNPNNSNSNTQSNTPGAQANPNAVVVQDVKVGTGPEATVGSQVLVNYVGKLQSGTIFDRSSSHGGPFQFTLGAGQVIPGWEQGIQGMKVGGERVLIIPPTLGYGAQQVGPIPANSTLIFDVTLTGVVQAPTTTPVYYAPEGPAAN